MCNLRCTFILRAPLPGRWITTCIITHINSTNTHYISISLYLFFLCLDCETNLMEVGFSNEFGYLNYCFAKQFVNIEQFENHSKNVNYTSAINNNMLKAFFKDSMSYLNAGDDLNNPEMYCFKNMNTMHVCDYVNCFKQKNVQFDDPGKSTNSIQYF
ncbi:uncharacterized protein LOC107884021 isoform X1 [Acyrthosiphon pisum]|uniref:Uncharacterized protein n=1 Tax=Acyrthosiphon pisum TaxID=7029 RepID=A0A8R2JR45_ACYPI|nr:uncharacterized protein LOC107884021 isoform X1 [Acyrthosiphon pisum]